MNNRGRTAGVILAFIMGIAVTVAVLFMLSLERTVAAAGPTVAVADELDVY